MPKSADELQSEMNTLGLSTYYVVQSKGEDANAKYDFSPFKGKVVIGTEQSSEDGMVAVKEDKNVSYTGNLSDLAGLTFFFAQTSLPLLPIWD